MISGLYLPLHCGLFWGYLAWTIIAIIVKCLPIIIPNCLPNLFITTFYCNTVLCDISVHCPLLPQTLAPTFFHVHSEKGCFPLKRLHLSISLKCFFQHAEYTRWLPYCAVYVWFIRVLLVVVEIHAQLKTKWFKLWLQLHFFIFCFFSLFFYLFPVRDVVLIPSSLFLSVKGGQVFHIMAGGWGCELFWTCTFLLENIFNRWHFAPASLHIAKPLRRECSWRKLHIVWHLQGCFVASNH